MLATLYPFVFIGLLLSIVWMFYKIFKDQSTFLPNISFLGASVMYAITLFLTDFSFYYKLLTMLPRDLIAFVVVFLLANNLKSTRAFYFTAVGIGFAGYLLYSNFVPNAFENYFNSQNNQESSQAESLDLASDGELMFDIKNENLLNLIQNALEVYDVTITKAFPNLVHEEYSELEDYYLLDIPNKDQANLKKFIDALYATNAVDWVEENEIVRLSPIESQPTDALRKPIDYGINDPNVDQMWGFEKMQVDEYFKYLRKNNIQARKKAKIAILDTGVEGLHEDLKGNYVSTKEQYDIDKQTHGTHCAGIAASVSNNALGVASLALNNNFVQVTSIKVLSDYGWGTQDDIIRGILEAADGGADVISMSLGGPARGSARTAYEEAIKYANRAGAIVVVAAGNSNKNAKDYIPASCKGVITVSALDNTLARAKFSNTVEDMKMGIAAPGVDILSTVPGNKYAAYSGTSMATPYVAGLLGIMKSLNPDLNTEKAYQILSSTGMDTQDTRLTGKMIHPLKAVQAVK
ncbi:MAG: S8 family serine peptidase [Microscillaceae bacterium]|nr:S8 family serine peptidase [Microscillaceae bacterium]